MKHLKKFESISDEYPYFKVEQDDYVNALNSDHVFLSQTEIDNIMDVILSVNRGVWYKDMGHKYSIKVIDEDGHKLLIMFKNNDRYFYIWTCRGEFYKCDEIEGLKNLFRENPQLLRLL